MLRSAPHLVCWTSTHQSKTCARIILPMHLRWPPLTARPLSNRALSGQSQPRFTWHRQTGLIIVCTKILSTRPNIKYVPTVSGHWTAALFRLAGGSHAPLNFNQIWCSQTRNIYISLDRPQRSDTLLKWLCHLGTTKYQMITRYRHSTLDSHCSWHFGSK